MKEMSFLSPYINPKSIEIPNLFYSYSTKKCFDECCVCQRNLFKENLQYLIEKAIKKYPNSHITDVVFEYAICLDCALKLREQLSEESRNNIDNYFEKHTNLLERWTKFINKENYNPNDWIKKCLITNEDIDNLDDYQIYGHFQGDKMLFTFLPYSISGKVIDQIVHLLSKKTLDELDNFMDKYLGPPPEIRELWKDKTPVFFL